MTKFANLRLYNTASISVCPTQTLSFLCNPLKLKSQCAHLDEQATHAAAGYARDDANRSKRYAFCGYRCEEWRAREAAHPMCLPATPRILDPANLFCNMQCTTVCITAAGSRVAKRTPGTCPGGCPSGFARQKPSVDHRGVVVGDPTVSESPRQPVGQPPESGEPESLTGRSRGSRKTEGGSGSLGPPGVPVHVQVRPTEILE